MTIAERERDRKFIIEATGMSIIEYAKDCLHNGLEFSEAYVQGLMTPEEEKEYQAYKTAYLSECLKNCPF